MHTLFIINCLVEFRRSYERDFHDFMYSSYAAEILWVNVEDMYNMGGEL